MEKVNRYEYNNIPSKEHNRKKENEFLAKLQLVMDTMDEIDEMVNKQGEESSILENKKETIEHLRENKVLTESQKLNIDEECEKVREERRAWKHIFEIKNEWYANLDKLKFATQRPFLRQLITNKIKSLDTEYKSETYTEEEILEIMNRPRPEVAVAEAKPVVIKDDSKHVKIRKPHLDKCTKQIIYERVKNGEQPKALSIEYSVCPKTIDNIIKKIEGGK